MAGTSKTLAQLLTQLGLTIFPNNTKSINAADLAQLWEDLLASVANLKTDASLFGLFPYDATRTTYAVGQAVTRDDGSGTIRIWICKTAIAAAEAFNAAKWNGLGREGSEAVTTGGTTITLDTAFNTANYTIIGRCFDGEGNSNVGYRITEQVAASFKVTTAGINGTFDYEVKEIFP